MKRELKRVPGFKNEDEEFEFWSTHDITDYIDVSKSKRVIFSKLKPTSKLVSLQMPVYLVNQLKVLANKRGVPYQSLTKVYLAEKVRQELALERHQRR